MIQIRPEVTRIKPEVGNLDNGWKWSRYQCVLYIRYVESRNRMCYKSGIHGPPAWSRNRSVRDFHMLVLSSLRPWIPAISLAEAMHIPVITASPIDQFQQKSYLISVAYRMGFNLESTLVVYILRFNVPMKMRRLEYALRSNWPSQVNTMGEPWSESLNLTLRSAYAFAWAL